MRIWYIPLILISGSFAGEDSTKTKHFLKYGIVSSINHQIGTSSMTKMYAKCYKIEGEEACRESNWIGIVGESLGSAVSSVPEAKAEADRIKLTTLVQVASIIATPVCLFTAIDLANGPKDRNGRVQTHVGPGAAIFFALTGIAFGNYIGWNIYEGVVARRAIRIYNDKVGVEANIRSEVIKLSVKLDI